MTTSGKIRIGIIGAGNIANVHINDYLKLQDECEITSITDVALPLAEQRAKEYGIPHVFRTAEELIASDNVDAVIVAVPNKFHASLAIAAMEAGKHVLLEKPMGLNAADAKQIVRVQQKTGRIVMVGHQRRFEHLAMKIKEQVVRGELGSIYTAKAGWYRRKGIPGWGTWFTQMAVSGGGPLIDIGVHMLDLSLHLMGNPKPVAVYGATYAEFGPQRKGIGGWGKPNWDGYYDVEDLATAMIRMEDGSTLTLEVSWAVHMSTDSAPFIHLMGSEGGAYLSGTTGKYLTEKFDQALEVDLTTPADDEGSRSRMCKHFLECIRTGREPLTSVMTGLTNNLILDAIYESSRTRSEVKLDWNL